MDSQTKVTFPIKDFSTYFCLVSYAPVSISAKDLKSFKLGINLETLSEVIGILYEMFKKEFDKVVEQIMAVYTNDGYDSFVNIVRAKSKAISKEKKTFVHFLLVCTLIQVILSDWFKKHSCFYLPRLCFTCLESIYVECYKEYFDNKEKDHLDISITALEKHLHTQKSLDNKRKLPIFFENDISTTMRNLADVMNIAPHCDGEQQMRPVEILHGRSSESESSSSRCVNIEDATKSVPLSDGFSESTNKPSGTSSDKDMSMEDKMEWIPVYEDSLGSFSAESESDLSSNRDGTAAEDMTMHEDSTGSTSKQSEFESSGMDENTQSVTRGYLIIDNNPSESTSKPSAFDSSCIAANRQVVVQNGWLILYTPRAESTRKTSGPSAGKDINTGDEMECVPTHEGTSKSTNERVRLSRAEAGNWKKDLSYYKNEICEICGDTCGDNMVSFVEGVLKNSGK